MENEFIARFPIIYKITVCLNYSNNVFGNVVLKPNSPFIALRWIGLGLLKCDKNIETLSRNQFV